MSLKSIFFIKNIRSKEIKKRLTELNEYLETIENTIREPVTNRYRHRVSEKHQELAEDYYNLIDEFNAARKREAVLVKLVIGLMYVADYSTNPDTNDELFSRLSKGLRKEIK